VVVGIGGGFSHGGLDDKIILGKCENEKDKH
jgi:hypothetical protein